MIEREGLVEQAATTGALLRGGVLALGHPLVTEVRGEGLLLAIELARRWRRGPPRRSSTRASSSTR